MKGKDLSPRFLQCRGAPQESRMPAGKSRNRDEPGGGCCGMAAAAAVAPGRVPRFGLQTMVAWGVLVLLAGHGGAEACPASCSCLGSTVDCHGLGIHSVPKNIPRGTERL